MTIALACIGFVLHFLGKWKETTLPFMEWLTTKDSVIYWITSLLFCALAIIMIHEWAPFIGMSENTYAIVVTYGGGHFISRLLNMKSAAAERYAQKHADEPQS